MNAMAVAGPSRVASSSTATPSATRAARATRPKSSSPTAPMNVVGAPSRAAATAWLPPFPPSCRSNRPPTTVSPGTGRVGTKTWKSTLTEPTTRTRPRPVTAGSGAGDELATVDADDVAVDELGPVAGERQDGVRDVLWGRHPAGGVPLHRDVDHRLRLGDLEQRGGHGDAGPDAVRGRAGAVTRELHRELPDMCLERGLGRRDHAIRRDDPGGPLRGHRVDLRALP